MLLFRTGVPRPIRQLMNPFALRIQKIDSIFQYKAPQIMQKISKISKIKNIKNDLIYGANSTFIIKDICFTMNSFANTFKILNQLIERLQANTGGEVNTNPPLLTKIKEQNYVKLPQNNLKQQQKQQPETKKQQDTKNNAKKQKKQTKKEQQKKPEQNNNEADVKLFCQIDIRIGQIVQCWKHPQSENLYCEKIKVCGEIRQIASGLQKFVAIQNMKGNVLVMANLKPKPLAGFQSNGMVVCASTHEHDKVQLLIPSGQVGERVYLQGHEDLFKGGDILPVLNPKRKVVQKCSQFFCTDQQGFVVWKGNKLRTKQGYIKGTICKGNVS